MKINTKQNARVPTCIDKKKGTFSTIKIIKKKKSSNQIKNRYIILADG